MKVEKKIYSSKNGTKMKFSFESHNRQTPKCIQKVYKYGFKKNKITKEEKMKYNHTYNPKYMYIWIKPKTIFSCVGSRLSPCSNNELQY